MYDFGPFLERLDRDWFESDELLSRLLACFAPAASARDLAGVRATAARAAGPLRLLAEQSALRVNEPRLAHFDAYGRRVDDVRLPASTREALRIAHGEERLGAPAGDPFLFYSRIYFCLQNGEAGVACSLACTDGLARVLEQLGDSPVHRRALEQVRLSDAATYTHGAQFVTEPQGGSDVPANILRAVPADDGFRLFGRKWFCSNVVADWFVVTGRAEGAPGGGRGIALFLVPARLDGEGSARNGYTIDRLKDKLGTRELPTAEVTFDGARAWPIGAPDRGIPNLLAHVLTPSRVGCVLFAAAALSRAERIAQSYAEFRHAFGHRIIDFPLVASLVRHMTRDRERALAAAFGLLRLWQAAGPGPGPEGRAHAADAPAIDFRTMLSLCKTSLTARATRRLHDAMMVLGGNGIEERFTPLPRLFRDSVIMETWEGPHTLLIDQVVRDMRRYEVDANAWLGRVAGPARGDLAGELARALEAPGDQATRALALLADPIVDAFADRVLEEIDVDPGR